MRLVKISSSHKCSQGATVQYKFNKGLYLIHKSFFNFNCDIKQQENFSDKRYCINHQQIQVEIDNITYENTTYPWAIQKKYSSSRYGSQNNGHVYQLQQPNLGPNSIQYPLTTLLQCFQQNAQTLRVDKQALITFTYRNDDDWNILESDTAGNSIIKEEVQQLYLYEIIDQNIISQQNEQGLPNYLQTYVQHNFNFSRSFTYKIPPGYASEFIIFGIQRKTFSEGKSLPDDISDCDQFVLSVKNKQYLIDAHNKQESCSQLKMLNQNEQVFYQSGCALVKIFQGEGEHEFEINFNEQIDQDYVGFFGYQYFRI